MSEETVSGTALNVTVALSAGAYVPWPVSVRLDILRRLCAHMEGMTRAAGYEFDMSPKPDARGTMIPRVYRGRLVFGESDPEPCMAINDGPVPDEAAKYADFYKQVSVDQWPIFVQGWAPTPADNPTDPAHQFMACAQRRLSDLTARNARNGKPIDAATFHLGDRIAGLTIGPGVVRPPQDAVSSRAFFYLPLLVTLAQDVSRPFVTA
jgi:hypothetical protein